MAHLVNSLTQFMRGRGFARPIFRARKCADATTITSSDIKQTPFREILRVQREKDIDEIPLGS